MKLKSLLSVFRRGPYYIYEPQINDSGCLVDFDCLATNESSVRDIKKLGNRDVQEVSGCVGYGINIYLAQ